MQWSRQLDCRSFQQISICQPLGSVLICDYSVQFKCNLNAVNKTYLFFNLAIYVGDSLKPTAYLAL